MNNEPIRNVEKSAVLSLADLVQAGPGTITSMILAQNPAVSVTLFAFAPGEEIGGHSSSGDAMVQALEGEGLITIAGQVYALPAGQSIVMPANVPHAVQASDAGFKMLLTVIFPQELH